MSAAGPVREEIGATLRLAIPIVLTEVLLLTLSTVDVGFVARVSASEFGGAALARAIHFAALSFGIGTVAALDPVIAGAVARQDEDAVWRAIGAALLLLVPVALAITAVSLGVLAVSRSFGVPDELARPARGYLVASAPTTFAYLAFLSVKVVLQAKGKAGLALVAVAAANVVNWAACGLLSRAPHGVAWALGARNVALVHGTIFALLLAFALVAAGGTGRLFRAGTRARILPTARAGALIGWQMSAEAAVATVVGAWVATRGLVDNNAYQAVSALYALAFMLSFGFGDAASLRVGRAAGLDEPLARPAYVGIVLNAVVTVLTALVLALAGPYLLGFFTDDPRILAASSALVRFAAVTHLVSGTQVVFFGVLRGASEYRFVFRCAMVSNLLVALPAAFVLGSSFGLGATGAWCGIAAGQLAATLALAARVRRVTSSSSSSLSHPQASPA